MQPDLEMITAWARQAGQMALEMRQSDLQIEHKGKTDLVTRADKAIEAWLMDQVHTYFPSHSINAEESGSLPGETDQSWFIDPIDGTLNYAHGLPIYCVSIAYAFRGEPQLAAIYSPALDECFSAEKGKGAWLNGAPMHVSSTTQLIDAMFDTGFRHDQLDTPRSNLPHFLRLLPLAQSIRRIGSAALGLAYVAAGRLDGFWEIDVNPWDVAAGILLIREAGGTVEPLTEGADLLTGPVDLVAGNPEIFKALKALLRANQAV